MSYSGVRSGFQRVWDKRASHDGGRAGRYDSGVKSRAGAGLECAGWVRRFTGMTVRAAKRQGSLWLARSGNTGSHARASEQGRYDGVWSRMEFAGQCDGDDESGLPEQRCKQRTMKLRYDGGSGGRFMAGWVAVLRSMTEGVGRRRARLMRAQEMTGMTAAANGAVGERGRKRRATAGGDSGRRLGRTDGGRDERGYRGGRQRQRVR